MRNSLWISLAILGSGSFVLFEKLAVRSMSPPMVQLCNAYIYSAFAPIMYLAMKATNTPMNWTGQGILWASLATLAALLTDYAFLFAIQDRPVSEVMTWTSTYPILSFVLCWLVLNETFTWSKVFGAAMIVVGGVIMSR